MRQQCAVLWVGLLLLLSGCGAQSMSDKVAARPDDEVEGEEPQIEIQLPPGTQGTDAGGGAEHPPVEPPETAPPPNVERAEPPQLNPPPLVRNPSVPEPAGSEPPVESPKVAPPKRVVLPELPRLPEVGRLPKLPPLPALRPLPNMLVEEPEEAAPEATPLEPLEETPPEATPPEATRPEQPPETAAPRMIRRAAPAPLPDSPPAVVDHALPAPHDHSTQPKALTEREADGYSVVKVFYGTDRKATAVSSARLAEHLHAFRAALATAVVALVVGGLALLLRRRRLAVAVATLGVAAAGIMAGRVVLEQGGSGVVPTVAVRYGTDRGELQVGVCHVSIPPDHRVGQIESPSILRLEVSPDARKHVVLLDVLPQEEQQFFEELRQCIAQSAHHEAFVFVHGYNVTFENAARRTAQIAHDLKFDGAPIFYSWPSQGSVLKYTVDENNVTWTVPHLKKFLIDVAERSGAASIHLVAHSMGNRALTQALRELRFELQSQDRLFNQVVLAAPDIDAEVFKRDIAPAIEQLAERVTLYASSNDQALVASKKVHGYPRAGDSGEGLVLIPGIETIDVSTVDTSLLGHSYYGDNNSIIADMYHLLHEKISARYRSWLEPRVRQGLTYWVFPGRAAEVASPADTSTVR